MRYAILDLGSNTFHLLLARVGGDGKIEKLGSHKQIVRLGADVPVGGSIGESSWRRAMDAVAMLAARTPPGEYRSLGVATSVFREARNGAQFIGSVRKQLGISVQVLTGVEEAQLSYLGATSSAPQTQRRTAVIDIGGGSIQFAVGEGERIVYATSLPLGVLRLTAAIRGAAYRDAGRRVEGVASLVRREAKAVSRAVAAFEPDALVFASGTARVVSSLLSAEDERPANGAIIRRRVAELASALARTSEAELSELGVPAGRLDTIAPGAIAMATLMDLTGMTQARVTEHGLREGVIVRALRAHGERAIEARAPRPFAP